MGRSSAQALITNIEVTQSHAMETGVRTSSYFRGGMRMGS